MHGLIVFGGSGEKRRDDTDRIAWALLNTREFQRLRRIGQLGFFDLVFPGATHSRFAHSVGVYHLARRLARVIARSLGAAHDPGRERVALLAALLHDVGHGPFSHAFEAASRGLGRPRRHEEWSAEIVQGDTAVNRVLRDVDEALPAAIGRLLTDENPEDIYGAIVSSQFDADRLDYIQRDRLMTGVEFGHIDLDWLFDCLEVGTIAVGGREPFEAPCLYLGPKGVQVAEEYLEARFRLYQMVYMHKTARAAEKMLEALLVAVVADAGGAGRARPEPLLGYLTAERPTIGAYLALDDATVWAALSGWAESAPGARAAALARRLRERKLYKCVDIGVRDAPGGNLFARFRRRLDEWPPGWSARPKAGWRSPAGLARRHPVRRHRRRALQVVRFRRRLGAEQGAGRAAGRGFGAARHRHRVRPRQGAPPGEPHSARLRPRARPGGGARTHPRPARAVSRPDSAKPRGAVEFG